MKVLVISHMFPNESHPHHGLFVRQQVCALARLGVEVVVVNPIPATPWPTPLLDTRWRAISRLGDTEVDGVRVLRPRYLALPRAVLFCSSGARMYRGLQRLRLGGTFDLVHAHVALPDGVAGARLARDLGVPLVVTVHGQDFQLTPKLGDRCVRALAAALTAAARVVVVSEKLRRAGVALFPEIADKTTVIPNGIDVAALARAAANPLRPDAPYVIVSVSNLVPHKSVDLTIEAVARLLPTFPGLTYLVIGDGPERGRLEALAARLGAANAVRFLGRLPNDEALRYVAGADVFSLPSAEEGFGVAHLEAMGLGRPVVAREGQGPADFITHGVNGFLLKQGTADELASVLASLLANGERAREIGDRARHHAHAMYTWENVAGRLLSLYGSVHNG